MTRTTLTAALTGLALAMIASTAAAVTPPRHHPAPARHAAPKPAPKPAPKAGPKAAPKVAPKVAPKAPTAVKPAPKAPVVVKTPAPVVKTVVKPVVVHTPVVKVVVPTATYGPVIRVSAWGFGYPVHVRVWVPLPTGGWVKIVA